MVENQYYPMTFRPVLKDYIWGGRNLEKLGRRLPAKGVVAESWEIAGHEDGTTRVDNGPYAGMLLTEVHSGLGLNLIGRNNAWAEERGKFPLLVKLLDANRPLSVQVHPDDEYALAHEGNELGKTEMWVILHAEPEAELIIGLREGTTREELRQAIADQRLATYLQRVSVQAGDHVCLPAGTLHAIMGGLIVAEIQQNSNTTYRVYDWGRLDAQGKPRPLHVAKALDVINFGGGCMELRAPSSHLIVEGDGMRRYLLCRNRYFVTERLELMDGAQFEGTLEGDTLEIWGVIQGQAMVSRIPHRKAWDSLSLAAVRFTLLPAALGRYKVTAQADSILLRTYVEHRLGTPC